MDSIVSVDHQYVSGTANVSSCDVRGLKNSVIILWLLLKTGERQKNVKTDRRVRKSG